MSDGSPSFDRACVLYRNGQWSPAAQICRDLLTDTPDRLDVLRLQSAIAHRLGQFDAAIECYLRAAEIQPNHAVIHSELAALQLAAGQYESAAGAAQRALQLQPNLVEAQLTLGNARYTQGHLTEAVDCFQTALAARPDYLDALNNLGLVQRALGRLDEAAESYQRLLQLQPRSAGAWLNLGNVYKDLARHEDAKQAYRQACVLAPDYAVAHQNLGELLDTEGRTADAVGCYQNVLRLTGDPELRLQIALAFPPVYGSVAEMHQSRARLTSELQRLAADGVQFDPLEGKLPGWFYLAYQGQDDRAIHESIARLCKLRAEDAPVSRKGLDRSGRIRVGFVSSFLKDHTIGQLYRGFIDQLPRDRFHVSVFAIASSDDAIARRIQASADAVVELPKNLALARQQIREARLDMLFYTDLGMDLRAFALATCRLAPVQCVGWGHPVTSGLPTIDYYLSSKLIEPAGGRNLYSEKLIELPVLPSYYYRPQFIPGRMSRSAFGIAADRHLYLCPQSLFKFHPDFDAVLGEILERDPLAVIVLIEGRYPYWTELLKARFACTIPYAGSRIQFLPSQSRDDFLQLLAAADVMLDTLHFGGGNTSYEAIAVGTPIVTLPSQLMRGRVTYGCYQQLGVLDCVAANPDEYIRLAVELGTDRDRRRAISAKLRDASSQLFENRQSVGALADFFERAVVNT